MIPNPFESMASLPDRQYRRSPTFHEPYPTTLSQFAVDYTPHLQSVPSSVQFIQPEQKPNMHHTYMEGQLPPVNHDQAVKRAKIQFTGLGDMFVFYNQLLNSMEQFSIFWSLKIR